MRQLSRSNAYALLGALLSLGAPLGLLATRALLAGRATAALAWDELSSDPWGYLYVTVSTLLAFALFGRALGRQADRFYTLSRTDPLTRLNNRRVFAEQLAQEFERATRYGTPLSVLLVDLDGLKLLNDRFGHRVGDEALKAVASAIQDGCRGADVAARWGGDEFVLLAPNAGPDEALALAERVRLLARGAARGDVAPTVSIGVATLDASRQHASADDLVRGADTALYEAKRAGRNRVVAR